MLRDASSSNGPHSISGSSSGVRATGPSESAKSWLFAPRYREFLRGRRRNGRATALEDLPPGESDPPAPEVDLVAALDAETVVEALQEVDEVFRAPLTLSNNLLFTTAAGSGLNMMSTWPPSRSVSAGALPL